MPESISNPRPYRVEGGHADFMLKTDMLRAAPGALRLMAEQYQEPVLFTEILDTLNLGGIVSKDHQSPFVDFFSKHADDRFFIIGSVVTAQSGAGGDVVLALAASEMKTENSRRFSRPRKNELIQDKDGNNWRIKSKNSATNPHQITITPALSTLAKTFAANDRFFIIGPEYAEATGQPKGLIGDWSVYTNRFAIMKESDITSGTNMTTSQTQLYNVPGLANWAYVAGIEEASLRHERNKSSVIIHGQLADNLFDTAPDFDATVLDHSTEGLIQSIETQGIVQEYDGAAGYDLADFKRAEAKFRNMKLTASDIIVIQGGTIASDVQSVLVDYMGKEVNMKYFSDKYIKQRYKAGERFTSEGLFIQMGFNGVGFGNYKFIFREASELNGLYGDDGYASGVAYDTWQFFIPLYAKKDAKTNATMPSLQMLHRGQNVGGYQRLNEIWKTGGAGPIQKTDEWDVQRTFLRSEICLMLLAGKNSIIQKRGTSDS